MRFRYRLFSIGILIILTATTMFSVARRQTRIALGNEASLSESVLTDISDALTDTVTLHLWYTDPSLTEYLNSRAAAWHEENNNSRLRIELVSGIDYLEQIQKASVDTDGVTPDLFLTTHDTLEKASLAGLASEIMDEGMLDEGGAYPEAARNAVTYHKKRMAYPFYFEAASLLYNKTYLENAAKDVLEDAALQEGVQLINGEVPLEKSAIDAQVELYLPETISDIMVFADSYNAPDEVEAVFRWDVNDIFYNYFFVGNYLNVGGSDGDDIAQIDIYNAESIAALMIYRQCNQFFAINAEEVSYDSILQDFIEGRTVFTVATTDAVKRIEEAKASGECPFDYDAASMPDLTSELQTKTMSVTNCIVVNGYSAHAKEANALARFLAEDDSENMYLMSGKCSTRSGVQYPYQALYAFWEAYAASAPLSKMLETANLWMYLEIAFTEVWNGADANETLRQLSERMMTQVTGEEYVELKLPDPRGIVLEGTEAD